MADGKMVHGGLFDRLKGIVSIYALSKVYGKRFGIYFTEPFPLEKYLESNTYDWRIGDEDVVYSYPHSKPVVAYSEHKNPNRLLKEREGQIHFYFGGDILQQINKRYNTSFDWARLYSELFKPSDIIQNKVEEIKKEIGRPYTAIHLRFMNLLGDHVEVEKDGALGEVERESLIEACLCKIKEILANNQSVQKTLLSSDSMSFLERVKAAMPDVYIVPGTVKHIDSARVTSEDENMKVFLDMYLLAGAEKIYSIVGPKMHPSAFPEYSSKIYNKCFERICL